MTLPSSPARVRVLLVDDEALIRSGFKFVLGNDPGIDVVGEASDGAEAVAMVRAHRPDVVLMDVRMPGMGGVQATAEIVAASTARVLAVTSVDAEAQLLEMLKAGADGYMLKDEAPERIIDAVHRVAQGDTPMSGRSTAHLIRLAVAGEGGARRQDAVDRIGTLTARERDVAREVAGGATNQQIGVALRISAGTVKTHLEQVFAKLGVNRRSQVGVILERAGMGPVQA